MNGDILGYHCVQSGSPKIHLVVKAYEQYIQFHQYIIATICCISGHIKKGASSNSLEYPRISMFTKRVSQNLSGRQIGPVVLTTTLFGAVHNYNHLLHFRPHSQEGNNTNKYINLQYIHTRCLQSWVMYSVPLIGGLSSNEVFHMHYMSIIDRINICTRISTSVPVMTLFLTF